MLSYLDGSCAKPSSTLNSLKVALVLVMEAWQKKSCATAVDSVTQIFAQVQDIVGAMKKEIHRMELRKSDLERTKEQLIKELERSIEKRDVISIKGRANIANAKKRGGKLTETQLLKKCEELHRSIADTDAECKATDERTTALDRKRKLLAEQMEIVAVHCTDLRAQEREVGAKVQELVGSQTAQLLQTERLQAAAGMLDSVGQGTEPAGLPEEEGLSIFQESVRTEQQALVGVVQQLVAAAGGGDAAPLLERTLLHAQAVQSIAAS